MACLPKGIPDTIEPDIGIDLSSGGCGGVGTIPNYRHLDIP
jgi:hypothetical protein